MLLTGAGIEPADTTVTRITTMFEEAASPWTCHEESPNNAITETKELPHSANDVEVRCHNHSAILKAKRLPYPLFSFCVY
ncbi:hypothetical protein TNIN_389131 [Trichonephila inaurata madagascariensis]|uniref:Uncharacterized protein n=1 Tax=Trichonephila inaurata madagascariensis TaxID=2747483 RepID=A0A8X7BXK0_9ARAC|nr:hypothetical protein TNIN_389131 [Trichonephila inaurata madagascariensis]